MIESVESHVQTKIDAMGSTALSTCKSWCTMQLLHHMLSPLHVPLQLPYIEPLSSSVQGYMSDQLSGGRWIRHQEWRWVVVCWIDSRWVHHELACSSIPSLVHQLKWKPDGFSWFQPAGGTIPYRTISLFRDIQLHCWYGAFKQFPARKGFAQYSTWDDSCSWWQYWWNGECKYVYSNLDATSGGDLEPQGQEYDS